MALCRFATSMVETRFALLVLPDSSVLAEVAAANGVKKDIFARWESSLQDGV
jgi:hypothetical protein